MARKAHNIHYIYKTTCNVTKKYYVGMHSTSNENDGYLGSGKRLRYSIRKYGVDNHTKEILSYHDSRELLIEAEKSAITDDMVLDKNCMNLKLGGTGGFCNEEHMKNCQTAGVKGRLDKWGYDVDFIEKSKLVLLNNVKQAHKDGKISYNTFEGKSHSEETKRLMSENSKGTGVGETNSQYGTCWIIKDDVCKKIKKEDLNKWTNEGWEKGRKYGKNNKN